MTKLPKLRSKTVAPVKVLTLREAIKLNVPNSGKDGMRHDVRHETRTEARRTILWVYNNVEHERLEDVVREDASEGHKFLCVWCCEGENEIGMLEQRSHVREGAANGPPLTLIERMKLKDLRFRKRVQYGMLDHLFHNRLLVNPHRSSAALVVCKSVLPTPNGAIISGA